jgi:radical SAM protein (TIGR01212 family)
LAEHKLYRDYSGYLQDKYGEKVYKLPVNLVGACPNRDGLVGTGGCIFCDEEGSGFEGLPATLSVRDQLDQNSRFMARRFNAHKFIAYFQSFTNTYLPLAQFKQNMRTAAETPDMVGIAISTRPDCVGEEHLEFLQTLAGEKDLDITIELGLQTVNYHTLQKINRGHTLAEFIAAVHLIKRYGFAVCVHLILNLPWDGELDVIENAKVLSVLEVDFVKLHSLYIVRDTVLGKMYEKGEISLISLNEYVDRVILFLEYLRPECVVQRLVGKGPQGHLLFCNWATSWWRIKSHIEEKMEALGTCQGKKHKRSCLIHSE